MNPLAKYQRALDVVSAAVLAGDFARYIAMIDLPYLIQTGTARHLLEKAEDLQATFVALSDGLKSRGVTHYERIARSADYVGRDRIKGLHHTHIISGGETIAYPHAASQTLVRRGESWLFSEAEYDVLTAPGWPLSDADIFGHADQPARNGDGQ